MWTGQVLHGRLVGVSIDKKGAEPEERRGQGWKQAESCPSRRWELSSWFFFMHFILPPTTKVCTVLVLAQPLFQICSKE